MNSGSTLYRYLLRCQRILPVLPLRDVDARTVQTVGPAVESADEGFPGPTTGVLGPLGRVYQPTAAMHAYVVVRLEFVGPVRTTMIESSRMS